MNCSLSVQLGLIAICYFFLQWIATYNINGNVIFSRSTSIDRESFSKMKEGISAVSNLKCGKDGINKILFDDLDVISPYLTGAYNALGKCELIRETDVTPFSEKDKVNCKALRVREFSPPAYKSRGKIEPQEVLIDQWTSNNNKFGYQITQYPCLNHEN